MPTELHLIARPDIEKQPEFTEVEQLARALLAHLNEPDVLTAIAAAHVVGAKSAAIQAILLYKAKELGFQNERKGLFVQYALGLAHYIPTHLARDYEEFTERSNDRR